MKTLILKASPKKDGNTATLADSFAEGLREAGHPDIRVEHLNDLSIRPCQACDACLKPPYAGCVLHDDFDIVHAAFRDADVVVFAAPIYWWHLCAQLKIVIDRMHPMLTFDRDHCLPTKHLVFLTAHFAEDPYGVDLAIRTLESISGWSGMEFDVVRYHAAKRHVREDQAKLDEARELGRSFVGWQKPTLDVPCPIDGCGFRFADKQRLAKHIVMAAGEPHLAWKARHLSATHTLENTGELLRKTVSWIETDLSASP